MSMRSVRNDCKVPNISFSGVATMMIQNESPMETFLNIAYSLTCDCEGDILTEYIPSPEIRFIDEFTNERTEGEDSYIR